MKKVSMLDKYLVYQPKVNLNTFEIIGLEALVRFKDSKSSEKIDTEKVIDSIKSIDDMLKLTKDVVNMVILDMDKLDKMKCNINISINMSALELCAINIENLIKENLSKYKKYIDRLEIEITEKYQIKNKKIMREKICLLKKLGFTIAIDDLGSGFNQSDMIKHYNVDLVKVDKSMVRNFNNKKEELMQIVNICNKKNIKLLVEGIESEEDVKNFLSLGFELGQGYYFHKPMNLEELLEKTNLLRN